MPKQYEINGFIFTNLQQQNIILNLTKLFFMSHFNDNQLIYQPNNYVFMVSNILLMKNL